MKIEPLIAIGIGNPGEKYERTYHNVGLIFADYLVDNETKSRKKSPQAQRMMKAGKFSYFRHSPLTIVKTLTFMNNSGEAVKTALRFFGVNLAKIVIAHDDSDIEVGKYKLSFGRGSAGHRGVESVIESLRTKNFWRLRIGIRPRRLAPGKIKAESFVLKKISSSHMMVFRRIFREISGKFSIK